MVDGIKVGSVTTGTTPFQNIPIELVDRIEVARGPRSSLYGSEAIGGVIQILTRKGGGEVKPCASAGAGRYDSYNTSAGISGGGDNGWYNLSWTKSKTEGFDSCENQLKGGCFNIEPDDDRYKNTSGSVQAGYRFDNGAEIDMHLMRSEGEVEYDGSFANQSDTRFQVAGGSLSFNPLDFWQLTLSAGRHWDESRICLDGMFSNDFDSRRDTYSIQNDTFIEDNHTLTFGFDYQDDSISGTTNYDRDSRNNKGLFAQYLGRFDTQEIQLSIREDDNQQFGRQTTGNAGWGYTWNPQFRIFASYGTAFKAPTFNDLYFPGFSNPELEPEESRSSEIGIYGNPAWGNWSVNVYQTHIDELISFDPLLSRPINVDEARIRGLEAVLSTIIYAWQVSTSLTLLDPENTSNGINDGNVLPRRARQSFRLDLNRQFGLLSFGGTVFATDKRYDDLANNRELSGYATVDLRSEVIIANHWRLQGVIENIFDKDYQTASYYNQAGRSAFITLRYEPK